MAAFAQQHLAERRLETRVLIIERVEPALAFRRGHFERLVEQRAEHAQIVDAEAHGHGRCRMRGVDGASGSEEGGQVAHGSQAYRAKELESRPRAAV
ncbi:MAG: hypothetical protein ABJB78_04980 [Betaproteobacteria bacterium]